LETQVGDSDLTEVPFTAECVLSTLRYVEEKEAAEEEEEEEMAAETLPSCSDVARR